MTRTYVALPLAAALALGGCAQLTGAFKTACTDMAALPPAVVATLDAQNPHSTLGVLWADAKSACVNGVPVAGVDESWRAMIWGEMKVLIPQLLPALIPLLVGLL
jgi:hypothetical protein